MSSTMSQETAESTVRNALRGFATDDELAALPVSAALRPTLALDSIDFLTFVERLAAATDRRIEESDYPRLASIASCAEFLRESP